MKTRDTINEAQDKLKSFVPVMDQLSRARNPFELRYFVIGKHDDRIQQYKQAVIEMDTKYQAVLEGFDGLARKDIERSRLLAKKNLDEFDELERGLDLAKLERDERTARLGITGAAKEVFNFIAIIEREFYDLIDLTEEELLEKETDYWKSRFEKQVAVDNLVTQGVGISAGNLSSILSMPQDMQREILTKALVKTEEVKRLVQAATHDAGLILTTSYPHVPSLSAPPVHTELKLFKDAPDGYPTDKILTMDKCEIMIATLHRPGEENLPFPQVYIPAGKNYCTHYLTCDREDMVGEMRNRLVLDALSIGADYIWFVDDDLEVPHDALQRLYAHDKDIVGGWYPKKTPVLESASLIKVGDSKGPVPLDSKGLVNIDWALTSGCTLIKTEVFKNMKYPWFYTNIKHTEDTYFTNLATENGYKVWLDADIKAVHIDRSTGKRYAIA